MIDASPFVSQLRSEKSEMSTTENYRDFPALALYIDRIGAEQLNFKRFMIKEHKGHYYTEKALIRLEFKDNVLNIKCSNEDYDPTAAELAAIRLEIVADSFPKAIGASEALYRKLIKTFDVGSLTYPFWSRKDGTITMVQQRIDYPDKPKRYVPWTYFSDGKWRRMEPDGKLPLWKPKEQRSSRICIHEGAKAAEIIDRILNEDTPESRALRDEHPWTEELSDFEHWGMIGGALAPQRTNYEDIHRESPIEVVYVCDNDWPGKAAMQEVSRCYGGSLKAVTFDDRWPDAWDLGDPFPRTNRLFSTRGRYKGPSFRSLLRPATYATEKVLNPNTGREVQQIRRAFRTEWYHAVTPECFIHRDWPSSVYNMNEFNSFVAPFSGVAETAVLLKKDAVQKGAKLKYDPGLAPGVHNETNGTFINTHTPSEVKAEKGDVGPWIEFLEHLFPIEKDRFEMQRWIATLIARPGNKMTYSVLLISETQGVGKTTLGEKILAPLMGLDNVSFPSESDIVDSNYNYWLAHKRLAIVNEIYAGQSSKGYDKLKNIVTDKYLTVSRKYQANYEIQNWIHIFACSNSLRALKLTTDDRRWLIPKLTEEKRTYEYWDGLNDWLTQDGGLEKIKWWAEDFLKKNKPVMSGEEAPWTVVKQEVIEEGMSPGQLLISGIMAELKEEADLIGKPILVIDTDLQEVIKQKIYEGRHTDRLEKPLTLRKIAKGLGWGVCEVRVCVKEWGITTGGPRLLVSSKSMANKSPGQLAELGLKPHKFKDILGSM